MLHHPHVGQIDRIEALNDSFYKTPCIIIMSYSKPFLSLGNLRLQIFCGLLDGLTRPIGQYFYRGPPSSGLCSPKDAIG